MNPWLLNLMPDLFVKPFAKPYIAGDSIEAAVATARELLARRRLASTLDLLAESSEEPEHIARAMEVYDKLIDTIAGVTWLPAGRERPSVSLKPSTFTIAKRDANGELSSGTDFARAHDNIARIATRARERGLNVTIDMEDHSWVDFTLETHRKLRAAGLSNVGTVLQSMLHRTRDDVQSIEAGTRIRMVIGIYQEPASIAYTLKRDMKRRLVQYAEELLARGVYVEYATHDAEYLYRFLREVVVDGGVGPDRFEVQMLLGVPRRQLQDELVSGRYFDRPDMPATAPGLEALRRGVLTRLYVPLAPGWNQALAYCRRRLQENPHIMWFGLKNLVTGT